MKHVLPLVLVLFWQQAWGWGSLGHRVVGQVAENNLSTTAKASVSKILNGQGLASVSNWADSIKSAPEWAHTKPWHFVDIPDGGDYTTIEHSHEGDIVAAISEMVKILKAPKASPVEKENALKFIVHFVGDIHQPLHVGRPQDRGGNSLSITFEGRNSNLHALWDTLMITKPAMDHIQYADYLETHSFLPLPYDIPEITFSRIINECMEARKSIYNFKSSTQGPIRVDISYFDKNIALANTQLLTGGKRLAALLNAIFI